MKKPLKVMVAIVAEAVVDAAVAMQVVALVVELSVVLANLTEAEERAVALSRTRMSSQVFEHALRL